MWNKAQWTVLLQVVLPDAKDNNSDIVVFLNAAHACNTEEDALQSGALAAMHAVAGDRNLHRILPAAFVQLWDTLTEEVRILSFPYHHTSLTITSLQTQHSQKWFKQTPAIVVDASPAACNRLGLAQFTQGLSSP